MTYADWCSVMLSQLADQADLGTPGRWDGMGLRIPRAPGAVRASGDTWANLYPAIDVDCSLSHPEALPAHATSLSWEDMCGLADLGQSCE